MLKLIADYLVMTLGPNVMKCVERYHELKSAIGILARTDLGCEYNHLAKTFLIALQAQSVCIPIISGRKYYGSVILGAGYSLSFNRMTYTPSPKSQWIRKLDVFSTHSVAIQGIKHILGGDHNVYLTARTIRLLYLRKYPELTNDQVITLHGLVGKLAFDTPYWKCVAECYVQSVQWLADSSIEIPDEVPMCPKAIMMDGREAEVLSAYGNYTFSPMLQNSKKMKIVNAKDRTDFQFYVRIVSLDVAIEDFKKLRETKHFTNGPSQTSVSNQFRLVRSPERSMILKYMEDYAQVDVEDPTTYGESEAKVSLSVWD